MKTLFYQVHWTKETADIVEKICRTIDCECDVCQVYGAPMSEKEIWFGVKEEDIDFVENQMNSI